MSKIDLEFNKNEDTHQLTIANFIHKLEKIYLGGGKERIEKLHQEGKMSARERIDYLIDKDSSFFEIGAFGGSSSQVLCTLFYRFSQFLYIFKGDYELFNRICRL